LVVAFGGRYFFVGLFTVLGTSLRDNSYGCQLSFTTVFSTAAWYDISSCMPLMLSGKIGSR
jgi:hypothetical protein